MSGLILPASLPGRVLEAARQRLITPVVSWQLAEEIVEVLRRPHLRRYGIEEGDIEDLLALLALDLPTVDVDVKLRDPDDVPVVAAAIAGKAEIITTGDKDLLADQAAIEWLMQHAVAVLSPAEMIGRLGR